MRRESSTVVVLVGQVSEALLAGLTQSQNVSVTHPPAEDMVEHPAQHAARNSGADSRPGWEPGALALRDAAHRTSTYSIAAGDPLAAVATAWQAMWEPSGSLAGAVTFEKEVAEALDAWRAKRFELPDYYVVLAPALTADQHPDLYLGPLRSVRPRRVAVVGITDEPAPVTPVNRALRSLEHGPWWPPLDEVVDAARKFYPGGLLPGG